MKFVQHYTYKKIIFIVLPPIIMMIFTSLYSIVDGLFLSHYAGKYVFSAVGFITPYVMMFNSVGFMFGTGGSACIAKMLGEKKGEEANTTFSTLIYSSIVVGVLLSMIGQLLLKPIVLLQGANGLLLEYSLAYGRVYLLGCTACIVQFEFQALYQTAGKGKLGLKSAILSGFTNIVLDWLFLAIFKFGIVGAAVATVISQFVGGILPVVYFSSHKDSLLQLKRTKLRYHKLITICINGSSEMVNNISISIVSFFYNIKLLHYGGNDGIAAYGIMNYVNFLFTAIFWGYISGIAPIISFYYGAQNHQELHSLLKKSVRLILSCSFFMFLLSQTFANWIVSIYAGNDLELLHIGICGFRLFTWNFLFAGFSIFFSSFFTALNNGFISAILSLCRVFAFQIPAVLILPNYFHLDGIWVSVVVAEVMSVVLGIFFVEIYKKRYHY